jgi:hypothetical protein
MHMGELAGDQTLGQNRAAVSLSTGQQFDQLANESAQCRLRAADDSMDFAIGNNALSGNYLGHITSANVFQLK